MKCILTYCYTHGDLYTRGIKISLNLFFWPCSEININNISTQDARFQGRAPGLLVVEVVGGRLRLLKVKWLVGGLKLFIYP